MMIFCDIRCGRYITTIINTPTAQLRFGKHILVENGVFFFVASEFNPRCPPPPHTHTRRKYVLHPRRRACGVRVRFTAVCRTPRTRNIIRSQTGLPREHDNNISRCCRRAGRESRETAAEQLNTIITIRASSSARSAAVSFESLYYVITTSVLFRRFGEENKIVRHVQPKIVDIRVMGIFLYLTTALLLSKYLYEDCRR